MVERDVFLLKPKHQFIYPIEWDEFAVPKHLKNGFLFESMFILTERWTLILKAVEREVFLRKLKHQFNCPAEQNEFVVPNH